MRIKEMITNWRNSWLLNKFSLPAQSLGNVQRTVWRICILLLGSKGLGVKGLIISFLTDLPSSNTWFFHAEFYMTVWNKLYDFQLKFYLSLLILLQSFIQSASNGFTDCENNWGMFFFWWVNFKCWLELFFASFQFIYVEEPIIRRLYTIIIVH